MVTSSELSLKSDFTCKVYAECRRTIPVLAATDVTHSHGNNTMEERNQHTVKSKDNKTEKVKSKNI